MNFSGWTKRDALDENVSLLLVLEDILNKHLEKQIPVVTVVAVMGTTEESSIDPLTDILKIRKDFSKKVRIVSTQQRINLLEYLIILQNPTDERGKFT